jgi:hypothetical protein
MARIKSIGVKQTAKFAAVYYFFIILTIFIPITLIFLIASLFGLASEDSFPLGGVLLGGVFLIFLPIVYALMGGAMVALATFLYNVVAKRIGGVEIELEDSQKTEEEKNL